MPALILILGNPYPGSLLRVLGSRLQGHTLRPGAGLRGCRQPWSRQLVSFPGPLGTSRVTGMWVPLRPHGTGVLGGRPSAKGQEAQEKICCANSALGCKKDELKPKTRSRVQRLLSTWFSQAKGPSREGLSLSIPGRVKTVFVAGHCRTMKSRLRQHFHTLLPEKPLQGAFAGNNNEQLSSTQRTPHAACILQAPGRDPSEHRPH